MKNGKLIGLRGATVASAAVVGLAASVAIAEPASAWSWSSTVRIGGTDGCWGLQSATIAAVAPNGESHYASTSGNNYSVTFGQVPSSGENITFYVYCSVTGNYAVTRNIKRPAVGIDVTQNI